LPEQHRSGAEGGDDTLIGGSDGSDLFGDALSMFGHARGGDDTVIANSATRALWGDSRQMHDNTRGGDDTLIGSDSLVTSFLFGDTGDMFDDSRGGDDTVIGGAGPQSFLHGDAGALFDNARGGNDHLTAGDSSVSSLHGDARLMFGDSRGGNDTLNGSDGSVSFLFGDAFDMRDNARGGNDTLISGTGTDHMWGDGQVLNGVAASPTGDTGTVVTGADSFVFGPGNGNDDINDFRQSDHDRIDVSAYGFHSIADVTITDAGADTRIEFDAINSVTLVGIGDPSVLHASDFIFA